MILDEIHLLGADRGPILEVFIYQVTYSGLLLVTYNLSSEFLYLVALVSKLKYCISVCLMSNIFLMFLFTFLMRFLWIWNFNISVDTKNFILVASKVEILTPSIPLYLVHKVILSVKSENFHCFWSFENLSKQAGK